MTEHKPVKIKPAKHKRSLIRVTLIAMVIVVLAGLVYLISTHSGALNERGNQASLVHLILILVFVASGIAIRSLKDISRSIKHVGVWLLLFAALVLVHGFQGDAKKVWNRLTIGLNPSAGNLTDIGIAFPASRGGHFLIDADVSGTTIRFLVDTGASRVVLSPADARRLGIDPYSLSYTQVFNTANGTGYGAPLQLESIRIGSITVKDVRASVNQAEMSTSLLGMTFLQQTGGYSVEDNVLTLKP